jgi:hypothetical protein
MFMSLFILRKKIDPTRNIKPKENQKQLKEFQNVISFGY